MTTNTNITKTRIAPTQVASDTYIIHDHHGEGVGPVSVGLNSAVILAAEPVIVDTGVVENREQYLKDVFSLVDPSDVRWIFISHDDIDHTGNLEPLVELCPNATVVTTWFMVERMGTTMPFPPHRMRWVRDGESIDVGDRTLYAVRPPVYDSPTTRGLYDPTTGFYWASDSFAAPMLTPVSTVEGYDPEFWQGGSAMFAQYVSPWLTMVDNAKFQRTVDRVEKLGVKSIGGCHTPLIAGANVPVAFSLMRTAPTVVVPEEPGQEVLDQMLGALLTPA